MTCLIRLTTFCLMGWLSLRVATADDWPQWRGQQRDGKSAETGLLDKWPAEGPKLLWQTNDLGGGFSTPSSAQGLVYLVCSADGQTESVVALSLADGKQKWSVPLGPVGENRGPQYPGPRSTPTVDGHRLYALASGGDLACLDAMTGEVKWTKNLPRDLGGKPGNWAYAESPLIDGDKLICQPGGPDATVVALHKNDGSVLWKSVTPEADEASYSSPIFATLSGTPQYVLFLAKGLAGFDAQTGALLWRYKRTADEAANTQTPIVKGDQVYTAAGRVGGALLTVGAGPSEPAEVYFSKTLLTGMGGAILVGDELYGSSGQTVICVDFATGKSKWQSRDLNASSFCFADGKLFVHTEDNRVALVAASPDHFEELGRFSPPNAPDRRQAKAWTYPIIVDGKLILRDVGTVWCYDVKNQP